MRDKMADWYEIKFRGIMGSGVDNIGSITILGRTLRWTSSRLEYEADGKHRALLMEKFGMQEESNAVVGPARREDGEKGDATLDKEMRRE